MLSTEQTLTRVLQIAALLPEADAHWYNYLKDHPEDTGAKKLNVLGTQVFLLENSLRDALMEQSAAKSGVLTPFTAARRICKSAMNTQWSRPAHQGAYMDAEGKQCVCDGYRAFRLNTPFVLHQAPDGERTNLEQVIAPTRKNSVPLTLPTVVAVKAGIKADRAAWKAKKPMRNQTFHAYYDFGPGLPRVNAYYLLDFLYLFPENLQAFASEEKPLLTPIYFKSPAGEGILCPARKPAEATA